MRKEVILAVIIGAILGGVILYGINLANNASKSSNNNQNQEENSSSDSQENSTASAQITIIFPEANSVFTETLLTLKGSTKPNLNLAIITESDDIITESDAEGNFSSDINLITGENLITVTVVDEDLSTPSSSIRVIRTTSLPI